MKFLGQRIGLSQYIKAPIDDKNVLSDSIVDSLFDDGNYVWEKDEAVGFVSGVCTYLRFYKINSICEFLDIFICGAGMAKPEDVDKWKKGVIEGITGGEFTEGFDPIHNEWFHFLIDDVNKEMPEEQLIASFLCLGTRMNVSFCWNKKKN